jgi:hypothetical protein
VARWCAITSTRDSRPAAVYSAAGTAVSHAAPRVTDPPTKETTMATKDEVRETLLDQINDTAKETNHPTMLLKLAEAYAWVVVPNNSHGGGGE